MWSERIDCRMSDINSSIKLHTKLGWEDGFTLTEVGSERSRYVCGAYLQDVVTELAPRITPTGIDVFVGWGSFDRFEFPPGSIIVHRGDEYALPQRVRADRCLCLKEYGARSKPITLSDGFCSAGWGEIAYDLLRDVKAGLRGRHAQTKWLPIPIGYSNPIDQDAPPILDRPIDVSFAGSINHNERGSLKERLLYPKRIARRKLLAALERVRVHSNLVVANHTTRHYGDVADVPMSYADLLKSTKVAVAPRGTSRETFRHFEAAMAGCVVVTEPLPDHWFYRDAPFVYLRNWTSLPDILKNLLTDANALRKRSEEISAWWKATCSPSAIADYIMKQFPTAAQNGIHE